MFMGVSSGVVGGDVGDGGPDCAERQHPSAVGIEAILKPMSF
jgi:hypothetical protein